VPSVVSRPRGATCRISASRRPRSFCRCAIGIDRAFGFLAPFHLRSTVHPHQRRGGFVPASAVPSACLAAPRDDEREMRPTDVCFPTHSLRAPAPRAFLGSSIETLGSRRFTTPRIASAGSFVSFDAGRFLPRAGRRSRASDTPVAKSLPLGAFPRSPGFMASAETASPAVLVKGRRRLRSGMPSLAGVTCSSNGSDLVSNIRDAERVLCRSRDFATAIRRSARFRSQPCPRNRLWRFRTSGCSLGPVREVSSFGLGGNESALLWARRRPTTSATLTTREHTLRAIDPRPSRERPRPLRVVWFP
jgi:hypothetical protein